MSSSSGDNHIEMRAAIALRAARAALGWSQEDVANHTGLAKTTVARLETASGQCSLSNVFSLVSAYSTFGIHISDLMQEPVTITYTAKTVENAFSNVSNTVRKRKEENQQTAISE